MNEKTGPKSLFGKKRGRTKESKDNEKYKASTEELKEHQNSKKRKKNLCLIKLQIE